ncbi:MAG: hypothetical protein IJE74_05350 [Clostridia bacterium]|nr:hypothetical protein [Clostridia bacterium]
MQKESNGKKVNVKKYIALAVFLETAVNSVFSLIFNDFLKFFYSDYAHLTIWGDVVAIVSVVFSFVIYDSFAHKAYRKRKDRVMFLGVVYVSSKAASIVHYLAGIIIEIFTAGAGDTTHGIVAATIAFFEIAVDIIAAVWLIDYFEKKFTKEENK